MADLMPFKGAPNSTRWWEAIRFHRPPSRAHHTLVLVWPPTGHGLTIWLHVPWAQ